MKRIFCFLAVLLTIHLGKAEDFLTLDGKEYKNVSGVKVKPDGLSFLTDTGVTKIKFTNLPEELRKKYGFDSYEAAIFEAQGDRPIPLSLESAFRLKQLEEAKKKARAEGKYLGFIMVWDTFFKEPDNPMGSGSASGLSHFFQVFNPNLVLVFVRHEDELDKVPPAVGQGFFGPEEGGFAPNMAVVTADAQEFICEIPCGGSKSTGSIRQPIFREKIKAIKAFVPTARPAPSVPVPAP